MSQAKHEFLIDLTPKLTRFMVIHDIIASEEKPIIVSVSEFEIKDLIKQEQIRRQALWGGIGEEI